LRFDEACDTAPLREKARQLECGFQPGIVFSSRGGLANFARLSFAHYNENEIPEGVARLRPLFD
jgi:DNA-binding transcriptional MocR family regulator